MRKFQLLFVIALVLIVGVIGVQAQDDYTTDDGRVNYWEVGAPVAVYCTFDQPDLDDLDYSVFTGIEVLRINAEDNGELLFDVDAATINNVGVPAADTLIAEAGGYGLYRTEDGYFVVVGPESDPSKTYFFVWQPGDLNC